MAIAVTVRTTDFGQNGTVQPSVRHSSITRAVSRELWKGDNSLFRYCKTLFGLCAFLTCLTIGQAVHLPSPRCNAPRSIAVVT